MKKLQFYGACGMVTGSSYLVTGQSGQELLVDFGMFQGPHDIVELNYKRFPFDATKLSGVVLTHAHLDHCGRLPMLVYEGFLGNVYMTEPTFALMELVLLDAARIAKHNMEWMPLYTEDEVYKLLDMVKTVDYDKEFRIGDFAITLRDAGHILGAASIEVVDQKAAGEHKKIVFSGDLGNYPEELVRATTMIDSADIVVMETTYGDREHPQDDATQAIMEEINAVEASGGVLLIPAFSLERTQDILHRMHHLKKDGKIKAETPVFLDSPMGIQATRIFLAFRDFYNDELKSHTDDPFDFEGLIVTEEAHQSKKIKNEPGTKVIIAGSGMMSGGRIVHHAATYLPDSTTRVLFVGYQGEETNGRKILEGAKHIQIEEESVMVKAHIRDIQAMSAHADQPKLLTWLEHITGVKKVYLVHGDPQQRKTFQQKILDTLHSPEVILPEMGQEISF